MPYGYYQVVRFVAMVAFAIFAYNSYEVKNNILVIVYGSLALLFQPFLKVALGRDGWNAIDVIVGIGLIVSVLYERRLSNKN